MIINVKGMNCQHCQKRVTEVLKSLGLKKIKIDLSTGQVTFKNKKDVSLEIISKAILDAGFEVA